MSYGSVLDTIFIVVLLGAMGWVMFGRFVREWVDRKRNPIKKWTSVVKESIYLSTEVGDIFINVVNGQYEVKTRWFDTVYIHNMAMKEDRLAFTHFLQYFTDEEIDLVLCFLTNGYGRE